MRSSLYHIPTQTKLRKSLLDLKPSEAKALFLKHGSYCKFDLPLYINFRNLLKGINDILLVDDLDNLQKQKPRNCEGVNYTLYDNKDGRFDWRPLELIHPALYVSLVQKLTETNTWKQIRNRFKSFRSNPKIVCNSIPVKSLSRRKDKAEQVTQWWLEIEQKSIELSLEYDYIFHTDITDCYGSIYTHSISWALHDKSVAKQKRKDKSLIGNLIDTYIQEMNNGQTNGIPQGSILMDFIAEMVLGYADMELSETLNQKGIIDYQILRYVDDYRVFVNNPQDGEKILKSLTEILIGLGMKLHATKTHMGCNVIQDSLKEDKLAWINNSQTIDNIEKQLIQIYSHSLKYPNAGSICDPLKDVYNRLLERDSIRNPLPSISIVVDIAIKNPRHLAECISILSVLMNVKNICNISSKLIDMIKHKFEKVPNTGLLDIWLQRLTILCLPSMPYDEPVCNIVSGQQTDLWNNEWIKSDLLKTACDAKLIIQKNKFAQLTPIIKKKEFDLFAQEEMETY
jgi:RNA-directed DNA polymerase